MLRPQINLKKAKYKGNNLVENFHREITNLVGKDFFSVARPKSAHPSLLFVPQLLNIARIGFLGVIYV